jgi:hypothetical protein
MNAFLMMIAIRGSGGMTCKPVDDIANVCWPPSNSAAISISLVHLALRDISPFFEKAIRFGIFAAFN